MRRMTEEELFTFDLEGYLVVKQVLSTEDVAALSAIAVQKCPPADRPAYHRAFGASAWGGPYQALIDHPRIVPYLLDVLGPKFRLDHDYCIFMTKGGRDQDLHGGATSQNPDHWYQYRDGVIRCGLTVVMFVLSAARAGDGGFCCIPGSHKSNFVGSLPRDVRTYQRTPHYVVQPAVEPGDAIIFTEALIHGTAPLDWRARALGRRLQVQPRTLRLDGHLLRSERVSRPHRTTAQNSRPAIRRRAARQHRQVIGARAGAHDQVRARRRGPTGRPAQRRRVVSASIRRTTSAAWARTTHPRRAPVSALDPQRGNQTPGGQDVVGDEVPEGQRLPRTVVVEAVSGIVRHREVVDHDDRFRPVPECEIDLFGQRQVSGAVRIEIEEHAAGRQRVGRRQPDQPGSGCHNGADGRRGRASTARRQTRSDADWLRTSGSGRCVARRKIRGRRAAVRPRLDDGDERDREQSLRRTTVDETPAR